jgi:hypothetical protein
MILPYLLATASAAAAVDLQSLSTVTPVEIDVVDYTQLRIFDATNGSYLHRSKAWGDFNLPEIMSGRSGDGGGGRATALSVPGRSSVLK